MLTNEEKDYLSKIDPNRKVAIKDSGTRNILEFSVFFFPHKKFHYLYPCA